MHEVISYIHVSSQLKSTLHIVVAADGNLVGEDTFLFLFFFGGGAGVQIISHPLNKIK